MKLIIVSGMSGAGKTIALKQLEDLGYTCIDNIPLALLDAMILSMIGMHEEERFESVAIGIDTRESPQEIAKFPEYVKELRSRSIEVRVIFLSASDDVILRRYGETRRPHPLARDQRSLADAIALDRDLMAGIANVADASLDTSAMNLYELREAVHQNLPEAAEGELAIQFLSFGFKNGVPNGCDFLFDVRCLPNPHWVPELKAFTGRDAMVEQWMAGHGESAKMLDDIHAFLASWLPEFRRQDRAYVTIGIGCTGGQHRSVYLVEKLAARFQKSFDQIIIKHKELR